MRLFICAAFVAAAGLLFAQDGADDRAKLMGSWEADAQGGAPAHTMWKFETQGASLHITNSLGDKKMAEFVCEMGKECAVKDDGKKVTVLMYFNGSKLVVQETRGEQVFKRRFGVADPGNVLELEMIPVVPGGSTETTKFTRVGAEAASAN